MEKLKNGEMTQSRKREEEGKGPDRMEKRSGLRDRGMMKQRKTGEAQKREIRAGPPITESVGRQVLLMQQQRFHPPQCQLRPMSAYVCPTAQLLLSLDKLILS